MNFTPESVLALSPDEASTRAARGLTNPSAWPTLGADERVVWGECQGSGAKPYQTQVDLAGPTFKCSCPSRKFPCKHGLALLLIRASDAKLFAAAAAPPWVEAWIAARQERAERKEQRTAERAVSPAPPPEAAEKRDAQRWARIEQGLDHLQVWLTDQVRRGLASLSSGDREGFAAMAARLVDQQAPALAQRLRDAGESIGRSSDWPAGLLRSFGQLQLVIEAVRRRAALDAEALADLRQALGWALEKDEVLAQGERLRDGWLVLAVAVDQRDAKLQERRVWLHGMQSGRRALLVDFSFAGVGFDATWMTGHVHQAELAFYPGAAPMRALLAGQDDVTPGPIPHADANSEWDHAAQRWSRNPWQPVQPLLLSQAAPVCVQDSWHADMEAGRLPMRIATGSAWSLAACTGGHPVLMFGEWDGVRLTPLTAWTPHGIWTNTALA